MRVNTRGCVQESHIMYHEHTGKQGLSISLIANIEINDIKAFFVLDKSGKKSCTVCLLFQESIIFCPEQNATNIFTVTKP